MSYSLLSIRPRCWHAIPFATTCVVTVALQTCAANMEADERRRPNIIVVFTDDHGFSDLQCQGVQKDLRTPNIDALAAGGVRMTSGYVTAPQCVPSRAGLLSGRSQNRFGVEKNGLPLDGFNAQRTIAERLKEAGYATGMTGKWHLGDQRKIVEHGFDDVYFKNANRPGWANFNLDGTDCEAGPEHSKLYHLDANSAAACAFIERHHDEPFFFYCAYRAPHVPLDAPPKYLKRFPGKMPERRRQALAMISAMDDGVGQMMATLRKHDLEKRTLIFIIGDNGAPLKIHKLDAPGGGPGWDGSLNEPLNGEKGMLTEGGIRVPFVVSWKGTIDGGQTYDYPVVSLDVAATAVALAELPHDPQLDGVNLVPFLTGDKHGVPHETLYWRWISQAAAREGKWKYLRASSREYLFDLDSDIGEQHNLIAKFPAVASRLKAKLETWSAEMKPPGLSTGDSALAASSYFDFYLDGKPAPKPNLKFNGEPARGSTKMNGWVGRGCTLKIAGGNLQVRPGAKKNKPFIATTGLKLSSNCRAVVRLRSTTDGECHVHCREAGEKEFGSTAGVSFQCKASTKLEDHRVTLSAAKDIVHLRLILPQARVEIESIKIEDTDGRVVKRWKFDQ